MNMSTIRALTRAQFEAFEALQSEVLAELANLLRDLETRVQEPVACESDIAVFKYENPVQQQRCVMLLARLLSSIHAQRVLMRAGHVQDARWCARNFEEVARGVLSTCGLKQEAAHEIIVTAAEEDSDELMLNYMEPGPRFQVEGILASPAWYREYGDLLERVCALIDIWKDVAVAFGHPGLRKYLADCKAAYASRLQLLMQEVSA